MRLISVLAVVALLAARTTLSQSAKPQAPAYDVLVRNGTVLDGTGAAGVRADIAIVGNRIVRVSSTPLDRSTNFLRSM